MLGKLDDYKVYAALLLILPALTLTSFGRSSDAAWAAEKQKKKPAKIDLFRILVINEDGTDKGVEKAYTFTGVIVDRARTVKRNQTDAEVKVVDQRPDGKNPRQPYDVIFLIEPDRAAQGEILVFTSAPFEACRPFLKTFLTKTLSSKRIAKAYKGGKLKPAEYLTQDLQGTGWLAPCGK